MPAASAPVPYLLELLKIIEGAATHDRVKVASYGQLIAEKLSNDGDMRSAERVRRALSPLNSDQAGMSATLGLARATGGASTAPVDADSRLALADIEHPQDVNVLLGTTAAAKVNEFITSIRLADRLIRQGVGVAPTMLLSGPPGCGKTETARHIAARLGLPLVLARSDALISSYLGNTSRNLRHLFEHAASRPCILFLDEFDSIAKLRDDQHELGELKRVVVSLLQNIDALKGETILLAATNHAHLLDPAVWRRFTYKVELTPPDVSLRAKLIQHFIPSSLQLSESEVAACVAISDRLSGADIREASNAAIRESVLTDQPLNGNLVLKRLAMIRFPEALDPERPLVERLNRLRELDAKIFSYRRLSQLLGVSIGHISNVLREHSPRDDDT